MKSCAIKGIGNLPVRILLQIELSVTQYVLYYTWVHIYILFDQRVYCYLNYIRCSEHVMRLFPFRAPSKFRITTAPSNKVRCDCIELRLLKCSVHYHKKIITSHLRNGLQRAGEMQKKCCSYICQMIYINYCAICSLKLTNIFGVRLLSHEAMVKELLYS